eukprot:1412646-Prymnesium_polylepis.2
MWPCSTPCRRATIRRRAPRCSDCSSVAHAHMHMHTVCTPPPCAGTRKGTSVFRGRRVASSSGTRPSSSLRGQDMSNAPGASARDRSGSLKLRRRDVLGDAHATVTIANAPLHIHPYRGKDRWITPLHMWLCAFRVESES